jgi:hypothetical protein
MMQCMHSTKLIQRAKEHMPRPVGSTSPKRHYDAIRGQKEPLKSILMTAGNSKHSPQTPETNLLIVHGLHAPRSQSAPAMQFSVQTTCDSVATAPSC